MRSFPLNLLLFTNFCRINKGNDVEEVIEIPEVMFNGGRLRQRNFYDEILLALTRQPIQQVDSAVTQGVSLSLQHLLFIDQIIYPNYLTD